MQRNRQRKRNRHASDIEVDRELEAQPEPSQAQKNKTASGEARRDRHDKNTWHAKKAKRHTLMRGVCAAGLEAGAVVASEVVELRVVTQIEAWVEVCSMRALLGGLLLGLAVRGWFTRVRVLPDGQEVFEEIPAGHPRHWLHPHGSRDYFLTHFCTDEAADLCDELTHLATALGSLDPERREWRILTGHANFSAREVMAQRRAAEAEAKAQAGAAEAETQAQADAGAYEADEAGADEAGAYEADAGAYEAEAQAQADARAYEAQLHQLQPELQQREQQATDTQRLQHLQQQLQDLQQDELQRKEQQVAEQQQQLLQQQADMHLREQQLAEQQHQLQQQQADMQQREQQVAQQQQQVQQQQADLQLREQQVAQQHHQVQQQQADLQLREQQVATQKHQVQQQQADLQQREQQVAQQHHQVQLQQQLDRLQQQLEAQSGAELQRQVQQQLAAQQHLLQQQQADLLLKQQQVEKQPQEAAVQQAVGTHHPLPDHATCSPQVPGSLRSPLFMRPRQDTTLAPMPRLHSVAHALSEASTTALWLYPVRSMAKRSRIRGLMCSTSNVIKRRFYDRDVSAALNIARIAVGPGRPRELSSWLGRPAMPNPRRPARSGRNQYVCQYVCHNASIGSKGVPVKQMRRQACKQFPGRVVLVHGFRTSRVSSARTNVVQGQAEFFRWLYPVRSMAKRSRIRGLMRSTSTVIKRRFYDRDVSAALNIRRIAAGPGRPRELSSWLGRPAMPNPGRPGQEWVQVRDRGLLRKWQRRHQRQRKWQRRHQRQCIMRRHQRHVYQWQRRHQRHVYHAKQTNNSIAPYKGDVCALQCA
ncbi:hypothetical protein QJQ45_029011 [Haematococcus lacustris]|nr:hypothetical protein QJQ45_029011 [Haematococcus lacustris]